MVLTVLGMVAEMELGSPARWNRAGKI